MIPANPQQQDVTRSYFENQQFSALSWTTPSAFYTNFWQKQFVAQQAYQNLNGQPDRGEYCGRMEVCFSSFREDVLAEKTPFTSEKENSWAFSGKELKGSFSVTAFSAPTKIFDKIYLTEPQTLMIYRFEDLRPADPSEGITVSLHLPRSQESISNGYLATCQFAPVTDYREGVLVCNSTFHQEEEDFSAVLAVGVAPIGGEGRLRLNNESGGRHPGIQGKAPILLGQETETTLRFCLEPGCTGLEVFATVLTAKEGTFLSQHGTNFVRKAAGIGYQQLICSK